MRLKEGVEGLHLCYALLMYFFSQLLLEGTGSFMSRVRFRPAGFCQILGGADPKLHTFFSKNTLVVVLIKVILFKYIYITL